MGEVYRARDTKLGRDVAIKMLPADFTADPERRARFAREARLLATLNHPHIGAIYGLEESDGVAALVLEFVDGPTLADASNMAPCRSLRRWRSRDRLPRRSRPRTTRGSSIAILKPANIILQGAGGGTAGDGACEGARLRAGEAGGDELAADLTQESSLAGTEDGRILGTPAYMSPEQARGRSSTSAPTSGRSAACCTSCWRAQRPFGGDTLSDTIARILEREPEWSALPPETPASIRTLLRRCLTQGS